MTVFKDARMRDHWKEFVKRKYPAQLDFIGFESQNFFNGLVVNLSSGLNVFVGRNGVGKSNFIRAVYNCLVSERSNRTAFSGSVVSESDVKVNVAVLGEAERRKYLSSRVVETVADSHGELEKEEQTQITAFMFDPCTLIPLLQDMLSGQENLNELLESHGSQDWTGHEMDLVNYLVGAEYTKVNVTTMEGEFESYPVLPYFKIEIGGASYTSDEMGMGELSLLYFAWLVDYMKKIGGHKILFIEEPESFLPPASQEKLANVLAMTAATVGISVFISTHSEHILKKIPRSFVHSLVRTEAGVRSFSSSMSAAPLHYSLGLVPPKLGMLLLEDDCGIIFAKCLIGKSTEYSPDNFYFHRSGSEGEISTDLKRLSTSKSGFKLAGLYDGDFRGKVVSEVQKLGNYFFLPGALPPDALMMSYFRQLDSKALKERLATSDLRILEAKGAAAGLDFHDYFFAVSKVLGRDFNRLFSEVCDMWIDDNPAELESFLSNLSNFQI